MNHQATRWGLEAEGIASDDCLGELKIITKFLCLSHMRKRTTIENSHAEVICSHTHTPVTKRSKSMCVWPKCVEGVCEDAASTQSSIVQAPASKERTPRVDKEKSSHQNSQHATTSLPAWRCSPNPMGFKETEDVLYFLKCHY